MAFTSASTLKEQLGVPAAVTQHDARLATIAAAVDRLILTTLGLTGMTQATYSDRLDVEESGTSRLMLSARPVLSVTALTNASALVPVSDYRWTRWGQLDLVDPGEWQVGREKVLVTYTAGFTNGGVGNALPPEDLAYAAAIIGCAWFNRAPSAGLNSESYGGRSASLDARWIPPEAEAIIGAYAPIFR